MPTKKNAKKNRKSRKPKASNVKPKNDIRLRIAKNLRAAREACGLSPSAVGQLFDPPISRAAIAQWEDDKLGTLPNLDRMAVLSKAYNVSVDALIFGRSAADSTAKEIAAIHGVSVDGIEVARAFDELDRKGKLTLKDMIMNNRDMAVALADALLTAKVKKRRMVVAR